MQEFQMTAKTFKGLEQILAQELMALGANNIEVGRRAVSFTGDLSVLYKSNLWLRTASRVLVPIAEFKAQDADAVYERCKQIDWSQFMTDGTSFSIDATVYSETFRHSRYVTYRVKDAIVDYWKEKTDRRPNVQVTNPDLYLNVHIAEQMVTISLDSSGESLHKRGYRVANTEAPISEALAAGMLMLAGWKGQSDFYDPMCGSGTLLIEAALIALNIAPGIFRKGFAFEKWPDFDRELFEELYNDDSTDREFAHHIYGSDASFYAVQTALKNVANASLSKYIDVKQIRLEEIKHEGGTPDALVMINPPYGERLAQNKDMITLYSAMGSTLKHQFTGATAWIISSNEEAMRSIGLKSTEKMHLLNGELDCLFCKYELFHGERKEFVRDRGPRPEKRDFDKKAKPNGRTSDRRFQLSSPRRENRQVSSERKRPQQTAGQSRRRDKRG